MDLPSSQSSGLRAVITGCGVSGLATALFLLQRNDLPLQAIDLIDPRPHRGGVITSVQVNGFTLEAAAQGVLASREAFSSLVDTLDLNSSIVASPGGLRRYLIRNTHLVAIKPFPLAWVSAGLLSFGGLLSFLMEPLRRRSLSAVHETLFAFCSRRFGAEWAKNFMIPLATGIWAGGANRILARHAFPRLVEWELRYGSVVRGALASAWRRAVNGGHKRSQTTPERVKKKGLLTFTNGMSTIIEHLEARIQKLADERGISLAFHYEDAAAIIRHTPQDPLAEAGSRSCWQIQTRKGREIHSDLLFNTAPPWSSQIQWNWERFGEERWNVLMDQPTHSVVVVGLGGTDTLTPAQGFGALAPEDSDGLLGVLYVHSITPGHAPPGAFLYRLMLGGDRCPEMATWTEAQCLTRARAELIRLGLISPAAHVSFEKVFRWQNVIPLADADQDARMRASQELETAYGGLYFAGNYLKGVGVDDCIVSAREAVERCAHLTQVPAGSKRFTGAEK
jgi:oxygen-dependent protoporphyrinogen oxidase